MRAGTYIWIGLGAALAFALAVLALAPPAAATNDPPSTGGPVYGDWTVTDARSYDSVTIWLEYGNLSVQAGGSLTLTNVQLRFNSSEDGNYSLTVAANGALNVWNGTLISSNWTNVHYKFIVSGALDMNNANASEMWGDNASWKGGIQIYSDSVFINNSQVFNGKTGGISVFDSSPTVTNSTIRNNGQDGASQVYCFGIYMTGSKGTYNYNKVYQNTYQIYNLVSVSYSTSPPEGYYYSHYYNGKYYWGSWGYYYRYEYRYEYSRSYFYGSGVVAYNSTLAFTGNSITNNGRGDAPPQYGYTSTQIFEGYGYGTSSYYWYAGWGNHYCNQQKYLYMNNYNYGNGVFFQDCTVNVEAATLDKNGFEPTHDYWPSDPWKCWYAGVALTMINCQGSIVNSTIQNSAILVNLTNSPVKIEGNKLLIDFVGTAQSYYSANFIVQGSAWGIKATRCWPDILNNTITMKFKDYFYFGQFASQLVLVDMSQAKDTLIKGNKLIFDSSYEGGIPCIGLNLSMKSTGVKVQDNTFEYKYSGLYSNAQPTQIQLLSLSLKSSALVQNCAFKGRSRGPVVPIVTGAQVSYGSDAVFSGCTFTSVDYGMRATDYSTVSFEDSKMASVIVSGISAEQLAAVTLKNADISGNGIGITATKSSVNIYNSKLNDGVEFQLDRGAGVNVFDTAHSKGAVRALDNASRLNVSWSVRLQVAWQNGAPVAGARAVIATIAGQEVLSGNTNETGNLGDVLWIREYSVQNMILSNYNPHRITCSKGRATSMDMFMIDKSLSIGFQLVDGVPPELSVAYPFDGQNVNVSMVEFKGRGSDPEAGLLDGAIEINIDNTGWVAVGVDETLGTWTYTRPLGDGLHIIRLKATDLAGNVARTSLSVFVDTTGPVLYVFSPKEGSYTNQRTVTVQGITEEGVLVTVNGIMVDLQKRFFSARISLEDGPNTIVVVASDAANNARRVDVHVTLDTQPPLLEIAGPLNGQYTNQDPVSVRGTSEPTAVVTVNGYKAFMTNNVFEMLLGLSEGANTIIVTAVDRAGNAASRTLTVHLDTSPPDLTLFTPRDGLWTNQSRVLVNGATEDGATVSINGQNTNVVSTVFNGYLNLREGANRIDVVARDRAGNTQGLVRTVFLDTRRPDLVVTRPADRSVFASRIVDIVGSVDFGTEVFVNGESVPVLDFVFATTVSYDEDGTKVIEIFARDQAGNSVLETRTLTVDTTVPQLVLSYPPDGLRTKQRIITVSGQTEPYATVIINTETMLATGRDGLFEVPVVLEDGENRVTVRITDAAGNSDTRSVMVTKPVQKAAAKEDLSWVLNLTGLLTGMGIAVPVVSRMLTASWRRRREGVLAEVEAAEEARREREAEDARRASMPRVERMGKKRARAETAPPVEKAPEVLPEAPKAEAAAPEAAKTGLRDKSGATEVSPDEIDQETKMKAQTPAEEPEAKAAEAGSSLKDKGGEAEGEAGDTEISGGKK